MARVILCDVCHRPTQRIVFKVFLSPKTEDSNGDHGKYTAFIEVGECCGAKEFERVKWRKRAKQPWKGKKNGTASRSAATAA